MQHVGVLEMDQRIAIGMAQPEIIAAQAFAPNFVFPTVFEGYVGVELFVFALGFFGHRFLVFQRILVRHYMRYHALKRNVS